MEPNDVKIASLLSRISDQIYYSPILCFTHKGVELLDIDYAQYAVFSNIRSKGRLIALFIVGPIVSDDNIGSSKFCCSFCSSATAVFTEKLDTTQRQFDVEQMKIVNC